jgi:hypothetical protein
MTTNTRKHDPVQPIGLKTYRSPTLAKGPVLSSITAQPITLTPVSGGISNDSTNVCWVARAAFGETDVRWLIFRGWLLDDAPSWFRWLYIRHGESVGAWLASRTSARCVVRTLMMPAVNRKLHG